MTIASLLEPASSLFSASSSGVTLDRCSLQDGGEDEGLGVISAADGVEAEDAEVDVGIDF